MKVLNAKNMAKSRQQGFTIIELIVVILLLGILTATALPRFIDVTDSAHEAVVDGVQGGLATAMALFHAQWIANGEPGTAVTGFGAGTLVGDASGSGYPAGADDTLALGDCEIIFNSVLQSGGPITEAGAAALTTTPVTGDITTAIAVDGTDEDIIAFDDTTNNVCYYVYVGQFKATGDGAVPMITYDLSDGSITRGTATL